MLTQFSRDSQKDQQIFISLYSALWCRCLGDTKGIFTYLLTTSDLYKTAFQGSCFGSQPDMEKLGLNEIKK